ncbi:chloride channel protein clc-b [Quercus suber]|uniref:Chloride channel protein clc-b n=1 Tax=Quercus suber TaxID=58331 RepID=A0AAW0JDX5_QUESU
MVHNQLRKERNHLLHKHISMPMHVFNRTNQEHQLLSFLESVFRLIVPMEKESSQFIAEATATQNMEVEADEECNPLNQPLLKRSRTLSSNPLAMVGERVTYIESLDYEFFMGFIYFTGANLLLTMVAAVLCVCFAPTAAGPGIPEIKAYLNGVDTPNMFGATTLIVKKESSQFIAEATATQNMEVEADEECNPLNQPLLKRSRTLSSNPLAMVGAKVSYIESLDNEFFMGFIYFTGANLLLTMVAAVLCVCFVPTAAGPGIPEIKAYLNGVDTPNMFGATTLIVKIIGSIGAVSTGLDLGKEGPLVHIGSCIASLLGQGGPNNYRLNWRWLRYFNSDRDCRDLITYGASSGVCAAFRAPVGGVLFSLEEVATWWRSALLWRTFFSTAVVVVVLRAFIEICNSGECGPFGSGGLVMFDVSNVTIKYHVMDIIPVAVIGIIGGVLGSLYNYCLHKVLRLYNLINQKGRIHKLLLSLTFSLLTSACRYGLPFLVKCRPCDSSVSETECPTNGRSGNFKQFNCPDGYYNDLATLLLTTNDDAVRNIFSANTPYEYQTSSLLIFFALYCILGLFTFGIAVPSGLFLPIILMGSGYGRLLGLAIGSYSNIDQGLFAVLGAASLMAGSMRMSVSLCVIFLELTNNLLLLPITMIVLLIAKTVGDIFNPSIYEINTTP